MLTIGGGIRDGGPQYLPMRVELLLSPSLICHQVTKSMKCFFFVVKTLEQKVKYTST